MFRHLAFLSSLMIVVSAQYGVIPVDGIDQVTGLVGEDYTLRCEEKLRPTSTEPAPDLTWSFNGNELADGEKYEIISEKNESAKHSMSSLTIKNAQLSESGDYRCEGSSGGTTINLLLNLEIVISSSGDNFHIEEGLILTCDTNGTGDPLSWDYRREENDDWENLPDGENDLNGDGTNEVKVVGKDLTLLTADPVAVGHYRCSVDGATKQTGEAVVFANLEVHAPLSIKVSEKEKGVIRCEVAGAPQPELVWAVNGTVIYEKTSKYELKTIENAKGTIELHILDVTMNDKYNNYTCTAKLGEEEEVSQIILRIRDPLAALWPFIGIVAEVVILIVIILIHEVCTKGEDIGETDDDEEDQLLQKNRTITRDGEQTRMRGTNN